MTGTIAAAGSAGETGKIGATVNLSGIDLTRGDVALVRSGRIIATLADRNLSLTAVHLDLFTEGTLDLQGRVDAGGTLDLAVRGRVPLRVIPPLTDAIANPAGTVTLSAEIRGTLEKPEIEGQLDLAGIGCDLPETGQTVHDGSGRIRLTGGTAVVETLTGRIDTGRFALSGTVDLNGFKADRFHIGLKTDALPIIVPETLSLVLNTDLTLEGEPDGWRLQGAVVMVDGEYFKDVELNILKGIGQKQRKPSPKSGTGTHPLLTNMGLDVAVRRIGPFRVDNNLAQLEISPDLQIAGTFGRPVVTGRAAVDGGTVHYRKKQFTVTDGAVDFVDPYRIAPHIRLQSETRVRDWTIRLQIAGPPDALVFDLSSDPPAPEGDILSMLLFGRTTGELVDGEGGTSGSPAQMIAGLLAPALEKDIRERTGLDVVAVDSGTGAGNGGSQDVKVTFGKDLSRRITIKYAAGTGADGMVQQVIAEYKLLENLLVNGYQGSKGTFGGQLRYRIEFR